MNRIHWSRRAVASILSSGFLALAFPAFSGPLFPNPVYTVGFNPLGLGMADFNGDGFQDFVVANFGVGFDGLEGDLSVLMGHGDGTFSNEVRILTSQHASGALAADVDGDGEADLILTYVASGEAVLLRGLGNGTFGPETVFATGVDRLRLADFNDDTAPDLLASTSAGIVPMLGNGDGTFTSSPAVEEAGAEMLAADFNGDGRDDILTALRVLIGAGDGSFTQAGSLDVVDFFLGAAAADVDGDGRADLEILTLHDHPSGFNQDVTLYFSNGDGTFTLGPKEEETDLTAIVASDRNGDGIQDYVRIGSFQVFPYLGNGDRTYSQQPFFFSGSDISGSQAGDFDGDGRLDLALMANFSEAVFIYAGNATGGFGPPIDTTVRDSYLGGLATDDFNGDGHLDMAAAVLEQDEVAIKLGNGDGTFGPETRFPAGVGPLFLASADMNGDGPKDLVLCLRNWHSEAPDPIPPGSVVVLPGNGDGTFQAPSASADTGLAPGAMHVADLDGDGVRDVLIANGTDGAGVVQPDVSYFHGNGDGTFASDVRLSVGTENHFPYGWTFPMGLASGDFDGDGLRDVVVAITGLLDGSLQTITPGAVRILRGLGGGTFAAPATIAETISSVAVSVFDLDGDGDEDIAVADPASFINILPGGLYVLHNDGLGNFDPSPLLEAGIGPFDVQVADMTGDGISDLVSSLNSGYMAILPGLGGGAYGEPINFGLFGVPLSLVVGDFDGDSLRDVLVITSSGSFVLQNQAQVSPPLEIDASIKFSGRSALLTWTTNVETDLIGFNIIEQTPLGARRLNTVIIPCTECVTGRGDTYAFFVPRHKSGRNLFIEAVRLDHTTQLFGPARRK